MGDVAGRINIVEVVGFYKNAFWGVSYNGMKSREHSGIRFGYIATRWEVVGACEKVFRVWGVSKGILRDYLRSRELLEIFQLDFESLWETITLAILGECEAIGVCRKAI